MTIAYDDRAAAYVGARNLLKAAQELRVGPKGRVLEPLPEVYWALLAEARILTELAKADGQIGHLAGAHMVEMEDDRARRAKMFREAGDRLRATPPACRVRSAGGRDCIHTDGHLLLHEDEHGWTWSAAGEHAFGPEVNGNGNEDGTR